MSVRFPSLDAGTGRAIAYAYGPRGLAAVLAATDDDLLSIRNFGPRRLAIFRALWPVPMRDLATGDPWRDHAEMVSLGGA